ncbi:MAG: ATP-dependent Clp protease ATP-binding subunit [Ruminococcaceae bacterium]|nr:ATP-dependent Clp protease ATP-binding subunit [Oscillospiraceae bacterium]
MEDKRRMKWQVDFDSFINVFSTFVIDGNIDDIQPLIQPDDSLEYVRMDDYLIRTLSENRETDKKCVIVYDPTESDDKRFYIAGEFTETIKESDDPDAEPEYERTYSDRLAQHFWEILHEEELEEQMIGHNAGGATLDMARIHYAVTENGRMSPSELLSAFRGFWDTLNTEGGSRSTGYVFVIKMTSRLLSHGATNGLESGELLLFRQLLNISQNIVSNPEHKLIVLANKATDLPSWFTDDMQNPFVKMLTVDKPNEDNKKAFFDMMVEEGCFGEEFNRKYSEAIALREGETLNEGETETPAEKKIKRKFLAYTNDFTMKKLQYYQDYLQQGNTVASPDDLGYSVSSFKAGVLENPWEREEKVREILNITEVVKKKIKGQDHALETVQNILTRAAIGLGRLDNPNAPRVVLFLAGPTGTGKTEICKQLAEAIFGSEDRMIRFDMSEYGQDHSDQKLFGAPPGYVGYEEGGKLTNAMKREPFSLVLFDEIEKAHGSIMDKFLQILSDGRLTDGKGETVSFTDAIIAFTSNAGVTSPTPENEREAREIEKKMGGDRPADREINMEAVIEMEAADMDPDEIYEQVRSYFRYNVKHYFCCTLGRPELYGRIEDSLVYYNYIGRDAVSLICEGKVRGLIEAAADKYKLRSVTYDDAVFEKIVEYCQTERVRSMGARGIGKAVGVVFESSLANAIKPYVTFRDGHTPAELRGKSMHCTVRPDLEGLVTVHDLIWSVR